MKLIKIGFLATLCLFIWQCNTKQIDTNGMKAQMKAREIKRVTPIQISLLANDWGDKIIGFLNQNPKNEMLVDSLQKLYAAKISKQNLLTINIAQLNGKEKEVVEAYQYLAKENKPLVNNLQKINEGDIQLFTGPAKEKNHFWRIEFTKKGIINKASLKDIKNLTVNR